MPLTVGGGPGVPGGVSEGLKFSVPKAWPRDGAPCCSLKGVRPIRQFLTCPDRSSRASAETYKYIL